MFLRFIVFKNTYYIGVKTSWRHGF